MRTKLRALLGAMACALAATACSEDLDTGPLCPALCPGEDVTVRDTVLVPEVIEDTTIGGLPPVGTESFLLIANDPATVISYGVFRFDSLPNQYLVGNDTIPITALDSAFVRFGIDTVGATLPSEVTFLLYDVSGAANDTSTADIVAQIADVNLVADTTLARAAIGDTLTIRLPASYLQAKVTSDEPVRLALAVQGAGPVQVLARTEATFPTSLVLDPAPADTAIRPITVLPSSRTPTDPPGLAQRLRDYLVVAQGTPVPPPGVLAVGGLPARRALLRFDLPDEFLDTVTVVRATLFLTAAPGAAGDDTVRVVPLVGTTGPAITDPVRQALLAADATTTPFFLDTLVVAPGETGEVELDIVRLLSNRWTFFPADTLPRVVVLRSAVEGSFPREVFFYSNEASDPALRPRLRLRYVLREEFGLP